MQKRKIIFLVSIILFFTLLYFVIEYIFIPKNIYMTTGESYKVNIDVPFNAEIQCDEVISINNKSVKNNIEVNLKKDNLISCNNETTANLMIKVLGLPIKKVELCFLPEKRVDVIGRAVGICVDTKGVLVLGVGQVKGLDGKSYMPCKDILKSGDVILAVNNIEVHTKEDLINCVKNNSSVKINAERDSQEIVVNINTIKSYDDNSYKLGLWVRDSTQGIGTITYYDRDNNSFGALGHPINDVDTGEMIKIDKGEILEAEIVRVEKGKEGSAGALIGDIDFDNTIGIVTKNSEKGIFGYMTKDIKGKNLPIGYKNDVKVGNASIFVNIEGKFVEEYSIHIDSINKYNKSDTKDFVLTITDKKLQNLSGGIVQGMSGCPVVQDGKLIGAVTHVFVNEPNKGYGIFIEKMINFD